MRNLVKTLMALCILSACEQMPLEEASGTGGKTAVTLQLCMDGMATRAIDESQIEDINIFIYKTGRTDQVPEQQFYLTGTTKKIEIAPGSYHIAVAANIHKDMGRIPLTDVHQYQISTPTDGTLCMLGGTEVTITPSTTTIPVTLQRQVAKIAYNISVAPQAGDIEITSVQLCHIPRQGDLGVETSNPTDRATFMDTPIKRLTDGSTSTHGNFYMLSNRQGQVSSIRYPDQRSQENAPKDASYILIRGRNGHNKVLDFVVYLGQNTTDDFCVYPNEAHTYAITIHSDTEFDTRIHSYTIDIDDSWQGGTTYYAPVDQGGTMEIGISNSSYFTLTGLLEVTAGAGADFGFGYFGWDTGPRHVIELPQNSIERYDLGYSPALIRKDVNSTLSYRVTISDDAGESTAFNFTHEFANRVQATFPSGTGTVSATGALESSETATTTTAYCYEDGCTLTANSKPGYVFDGWYADSGYTQLLSAAAMYKYVPTAADARIYARFSLNIAYKVQINCTESNKNSTYMYNRNTVSITSENYSGALNIRISNPSGGIFAPGTILQYSKTIASGQTQSIDPIVFIPITVGTVSYTIDVETGNGFNLATRTVTNTAAATKLTPSIRIDYGTQSSQPPYPLYGATVDWFGYKSVVVNVSFTPALDYSDLIEDRTLINIQLTPQYRVYDVTTAEDGNTGHWTPVFRYLSGAGINGLYFNDLEATYNSDQGENYTVRSVSDLSDAGGLGIRTRALFGPKTDGYTALKLPDRDDYAVDANMTNREFINFWFRSQIQASEIQVKQVYSGTDLKLETRFDAIPIISTLVR